jgi:hypothetical protein
MMAPRQMAVHTPWMDRDLYQDALAAGVIQAPTPEEQFREDVLLELLAGREVHLSSGLTLRVEPARLPD